MTKTYLIKVFKDGTKIYRTRKKCIKCNGTKIAKLNLYHDEILGQTCTYCNSTGYRNSYKTIKKVVIQNDKL